MTDQEKMTDILGQIVTMTDGKCLQTIQDTAYSHKRDVNRKLANIETASWCVNDKVQMIPKHRNTKPFNEVGTIKKINKVRIKVDFPAGVWSIPKSMLMKAE